MDAQELKSKLLEHKVAAFSAVVALSVGTFAYVRQDALVSAEQARESVEANLKLLRYNQQNGGPVLLADLAAMESFYQQIVTRALDFDSGIASQAFFSDLIQSKGFKIEGIPALSGQPVSTVKPFAYGAYFIQGSGASAAMLEFARKCEEHSVKALRVDRLQLSLGDTASSSAAQPAVDIMAGLALRSWGYRSEVGPLKFGLPVVGPKPEKVGVTRVQRQQKLEAAKAAFAKRVNLSAVHHLLGAPSAAPEDDGAISLLAVESALKALKITRKRIFGQQAISGDKIGTKRVGNNFDLVAEGVTYKVTLRDVTAESAIFLVSGKTIKIPLAN